MELEYIIEICVAIDIAIMGIAYPIIVDKISNIGEKYSSQYISEVFDREFPQNSVEFNFFKRQYKLSIFKITLYLTILSFLFLILKFEPLFGWHNWVINNSAKLIVFVATISLTVVFFIWLDKVVLFNGKSSSILKRIISKYGSKKINTEFKSYCLKSINEMTFYAIDKQDEHLQETLLEFYSREFWKIRKNHDKKMPLIYPIDLYFFINKLNVELVNNQNKKLLAIEHRAVSGVWLLGEDFEHIIISEETYRWIWQNLYTISDKDKFIRMYWANVSQYFEYRLRHLYDENETNEREEERNQFLELHYALGGLVLYRNKYLLIKYIFEYTQSQPPRYPLLPQNMTEIFKWFEYFRNEFKMKGGPIDTKYYFPELDNLGSTHQIRYWICSYLCLLFIRQYSLHPYYVYQSHTSLPELPNDVIELNNWLDSTSYFKHYLDKVLINQNLINDLQFSQTVNENIDNFNAFLKNLKDAIIEKIGQQKLYAPLSPDKIENFKKTTDKIISQAFSYYDNVLNSSFVEKKDSDLKISVHGEKTLMTKSAFTDNDIPHLNFNSIIAEHIAEHNIKRFIPYSFLVSTTRRYLLNKENILTGLEILIENNNAVIVGINVGYELKEFLNKSKFESITRYIPSTQYQLQDILFVLDKMDLPSIERIDPKDSEKEEFQLSLINDNLKLYASIIDINTSGNRKIKDKWAETNREDNDDLKVQVSISFLSIIYWSNDRDVVQINLASEFKEQGIQNSINEIETLKKTLNKTNS